MNDILWTICKSVVDERECASNSIQFHFPSFAFGGCHVHRSSVKLQSMGSIQMGAKCNKDRMIEPYAALNKDNAYFELVEIVLCS